MYVSRGMLAKEKPIERQSFTSVDNLQEGS